MIFTLVSDLAIVTNELRTPMSLAPSFELPGAKNTARLDELTGGVDGDGLAIVVGVGVGVGVVVVPFWFDEPLFPAPAARNVAVVLADCAKVTVQVVLVPVHTPLQLSSS